MNIASFKPLKIKKLKMVLLLKLLPTIRLGLFSCGTYGKEDKDGSLKTGKSIVKVLPMIFRLELSSRGVQAQQPSQELSDA